MKLFFSVALLSVLGLSQAEAQRWRQPDMERVAQLAHDVDEAAEHVHLQAERETDNQWGRDSHTLLALHEFAEAAEHFHRAVEQHREDPRHTQRDFEELQYAFREASRAMHYARFSQHVMNDWWEASDAMRELRRYYRGGGHR